MIKRASDGLGGNGQQGEEGGCEKQEERKEIISRIEKVM